MGILDEDVARVREATDLVALASEYVQLKRVGRRFMARCPFHDEKTPSFSINPELGVYFCFGCQARGDAITLVRELEHLDFVDAVERLAGRAGIALRYDDASFSEERKRRERLHDAVGAAIDFYHDLLLSSPDGARSRGYLRSRGFDGDAARQFRLGYSPDGFEVLCRHLYDLKFSRKDVVEAGLAFENRARRIQDQFRDRLMFPIHDHRGQPVGFGGRALVDGQGPKYKNSPDTSIYHKSRLLFWLHEAKAEIVARGDVIVCEGYTDVMAFVLAGFANAVATCGTALTDEHFQALKNLSPQVTLAYDADAAGQAAAERCYQWEQRSEVQFRIADLPPGADPADAWHDDPDSLGRALDEAAPFLQFRLDRLLAGAPRDTVEGRARAAEHGAALIAQHPSDLVRDQYAVKLAADLGLDADRVRGAVARAGRRRGGAPDATHREPVSEAQRPVDRRELDALRWAVHAPLEIGGRLDRALFADPTARAAYDALASAQTFSDALEGASEEVRALLERLAVEEPGDEEDSQILIAHVVVYLVEASSQRRLATMVSTADERSAELKSMLDELAVAREAGEWSTAEDIAGQLVTWLRIHTGETILEPDERGN